jgi:hypothetical protein
VDVAEALDGVLVTVTALAYHAGLLRVERDANSAAPESERERVIALERFEAGISSKWRVRERSEVHGPRRGRSTAARKPRRCSVTLARPRSPSPPACCSNDLECMSIRT